MTRQSSEKPWSTCSTTRRTDATWGGGGGISWSRSSTGESTCPGSGSSPRRYARKPALRHGRTTSKNVPRHRPSIESEPLPVHEGPVPRRREGVDSVSMGSIPERGDDRRPFFPIFGRRQTKDPIQDNGGPIPSGGVLSGPVQLAVVHERRAPRPGRPEIRLHRVRCVGLPGSAEIRGVPDSKLRKRPMVPIRVEEPEPSVTFDEGVVEAREAGDG